MCFFCLVSVSISVCSYLIDCLYPPLSFFVIHSCFPHLFMCLCLDFCLSFPPCPCPFSVPSFSIFFCSCLCSFFLPLHHLKFVQRRAQFDSVSLGAQGSMEGELSLMDNLSGSICHYYSLPPKPGKHSTDKKVNNRQNDNSLPPFHTSSGPSYFSPMCREHHK